MPGVTDEPGRDAREARDATRGSAIKLVAEVASRLLGLATTLLLIRGLGATDFGAFGRLSVIALLLAELGGARAADAGVAGPRRGDAVARGAGAGAAGAAAVLVGGRSRGWAVAPTLSPLVLWFALSGWGEFLGVALRCRGERVAEALLLLCLRGVRPRRRGGGARLGRRASRRSRGRSCCRPPPRSRSARGCSGAPRRPTAGGDARVAAVMSEALPLAIHGGLVLLSPRVEFLVLSLLRGDREIGPVPRGAARLTSS